MTFVIEAIVRETDMSATWVEQLRYMRMLSVVKMEDGYTVVHFRCPDPDCSDTQVWAEQCWYHLAAHGIAATIRQREDTEP